VAAYLDASDFLEGQKNTWEKFKQNIVAFPNAVLPYEDVPPNSLVTRLRAFGSPVSFRIFDRAESQSLRIPVFRSRRCRYFGSCPTLLLLTPPPGQTFDPNTVQKAIQVFESDVEHFEDVVHDELTR
jgi:hypothetical protein